jgi:hypothetical protein
MTKNIQTTGTRAQVFHGTAVKTSGGLHKSDLMQNKSGRIVSRRKHNSAKKEMRLVKHGFGTKKGKFGFVKMGKSKSRKHRGGSGLSALNPAEIDYQMSMPNVNGLNDMAGGAYGNSFSPADAMQADKLMGGKSRSQSQQRSRQQQRQKQKQMQKQQQKQKQMQKQQQKQMQQQVAGNADVNDSYMLSK